MFRKHILRERASDKGVHIMWNTNGRMKQGKAALAEGSYMEGGSSDRKFSKGTAMVLGILITFEIMIAAAMLFNIDFHGADIIALLFAFMVLYAGVVALLTDK